VSILRRSAAALLRGDAHNVQGFHAPFNWQQPVSLAGAAWRQWLSTNAVTSKSKSEATKIPRAACLSDVRGVLRLSGEDVLHFLNVRPLKI
jgi:hypothetical protein